MGKMVGEKINYVLGLSINKQAALKISTKPFEKDRVGSFICSSSLIFHICLLLIFTQ